MTPLSTNYFPPSQGSISWLPALLQQNRINQALIQHRLLDLAARQLPFLEAGQVNPQMTQELANLAIASGLAGSNMNFHA